MFKVPKKTSVWKVDGKSPVGTMKFAPELIKFIKDRRKYHTYRFADEKYSQMKVGDKVIIKENFVEEPVGGALITKITKTTFVEIPLNDEGHERAKSKEHQRQVLSGYYAFLGRPITDDDPFLIIEFELL